MTHSDDRAKSPTPLVKAARTSAVPWLGVGLLLSLAINAFIVGMIATKVYKAKETRTVRLPAIIDAQVDSRRMLRSVDKERRKELRKIERGYRDRFTPYAEKLDRSRRDLAAVVRESTLDRAKLEAAFHKVQEARTGMREISSTMIVELIAAMTPAERVSLAERLERKKKKRKKKKSKTKKKKDDG